MRRSIEGWDGIGRQRGKKDRMVTIFHLEYSAGSKGD